MGCCCKQLGNGRAGNGAATLAPNPVIAPIYTTQGGACGANGAMQANSPYLVSPDDYANLPAMVSVPVISRLGRVSPNNTYVVTSFPPGVVQVQSPKVGRY
jgi:hypothetical protein